MKLIFKGKVELGDDCRVGNCDKDGAIIIGGRDVVGEIAVEEWKNNRVLVGIADKEFDGELFVETGWGYSEYTPMDSDELKVGSHDLVSILKSYKDEEITVYISDEPINILED